MNRIKDLRLQNKWRQQDLADKMNTAKSVISRYETGQLDLDTGLINRFCDLFGCTSDYLLGRSATPLPALSDEDARLLDAFHAASPETQAAIRLLILPPVSGKKAVS